jgi:hypothetical protein
VSILVEIADRADVTVEGVVRVLTREPVSGAVKERVLAILDELGAEQTRILERFALAAIHDIVPPRAEREEEDGRAAVERAAPEADRENGRAVERAAPDADREADGAEPSDRRPEPSSHRDDTVAGIARAGDNGSPQRAAGSDVSEKDVLSAQVGMVLEELVAAVKEMKREGLADRQERIDDLAVLVDLMTTGWKGVDRRLGRVERLVARMEPVVPFAAATPVRAEPVPARLEPARDLAPPVEAPSEPKRAWLPLTAILVLLASVILAVLAFDLLPSGSDRPRLLPSPESASAPSKRTAPTTTARTSTAPSRASPGATTPRASATTAAPRTSTPARTSPAPAATQPPVSTASKHGARLPPATSSTPTATSEAGTTASPAQTTGSSATAGTQGFHPARDFVWPPVDGADYYQVQFFRGGKLFYDAKTPGPRLTVPKTLVFRPGSYRWVVRPGFGPRSENRIGQPVVDSAFTVAS